MPEPQERPPIAQAPLSVVLLAQPGEAGLDEVVRDWVAYLDSLGREYEVLVVDAGGADRLLEAAEPPAVPSSGVRALHPSMPTGVGAALRTGLAATRFPLFFYADGTRAYQPRDLALLLDVIDHVDLVSGYRVGPKRRYRETWKEWLFRWLVRVVFGVHLRDMDCSFKLFRKTIFTRIPVQSDGPFAHAEILAKANFLGCLITEVAVSYDPDRLARAAPADLRQKWSQSWRVFRHPDFGPAALPQETPGPPA
jgi:glycosyltransferase involved in cell wall biosynthesis